MGVARTSKRENSGEPLSEELINQVWCALEAGEKKARIARRLGIHRCTVHRINRGSHRPKRRLRHQDLYPKIAELLGQGKTVSEIAFQLTTSHGVVKRSIRSQGKWTRRL